MENRFISMFGFQVKKEYVLNKIKEYLNIQEEIDYENPPEIFKETFDTYFSIQNITNKNDVLPELEDLINSINKNSNSDKNIFMVCENTFGIGYVQKETVKSLEDSLTFNYDNGEDNSEIISHITSLKDFFDEENIVSPDLSFFEYSFHYDTSKYPIIPKYEPSKTLSKNRIFDYFTQLNKTIPPHILQHIV